jgi:hypothetical protein
MDTAWRSTLIHWAFTCEVVTRVKDVTNTKSLKKNCDFISEFLKFYGLKWVLTKVGFITGL